MINRIVKLSFHPQHTQQFISIFEESKPHIQNMPGCNGVKLLQDISQHNVFFTYSYWQSQADLDVYRNSPLFETTWAKTKVLFNDKPMAWSTNIIA